MKPGAGAVSLTSPVNHNLGMVTVAQGYNCTRAYAEYWFVGVQIWNDDAADGDDDEDGDDAEQ